MASSKKPSGSAKTTKSKKTGRKGVKNNPAPIEEYIEKITPYLKRDNSLKKACILAEVPYTTVLDHCNKNYQVRSKIDKIINSCQDLAKQVVMDAIRQGDASTAKWWLEKREKDYQPAKQVEVSTDRGTPNELTDQESEAFGNMLENLFEE